jgi:hypothetical protein
MADITGVKITDLTASGSSDDGEHIWITHKIGDGSEYPLIYPYEALGYLIAVLTDAAGTAYKRRVARNPQEITDGTDSNVLPIDEVKIGTVADKSGVILHLTTADRIPIAVEVPAALLGDVVAQLQLVLESLPSTATIRKHLH